MEDKEIKITNNMEVKMILSLEPEGTIQELLHGQSVTIELFAASGPIIDLQINKDVDGIYLSIWPDQGRYSLKE
jgi:hypothetical protein